MLKDQPWLRLGSDLTTQYEQCAMEGRDVAVWKPVVQQLTALPPKELCAAEKAIEEISVLLENTPVRADFGFDEPSALEEILAAAPMEKPVLPALPDKEVLSARLQAAWNGRVAGCLLGKPVEGWRTPQLHEVLKATGNWPMHRYIRRDELPDELVEKYSIYTANTAWADQTGGAMPVDDDTNYTAFALKLVEEYGRDFTAADVLEAWMRWIPALATCTAERVAYRNGCMGLLPPETAVYKNPYREWIGAQIRGDLFGYINPGDPAAAADMAFRDASISHVKNGIYGEMFIAAALAAAAVCDDVMTVIRTGLAYIPAGCRLRADIDEILSLYTAGADADAAMAHIHSRYDEFTAHGWCMTNPNTMIVVMALLWGSRDFGKTLCLAVQPGFDTDCNGATAGSILGMLNGSVPDEWLAPFEGNVITSIEGFHHVHTDDMAARTLALCRLPEKPAPTEAPAARGCFCPSCGAQVEDYYIFCSECGARL